MIVIRLQPTGRRNAPTYRIVAAEKARAVNSKYLALLGHYLPTRTPPDFKADHEAIAAWIKKGASPSDTVARLLTKDGMKGLEKFMERYSKKAKKNPSEAEIAAAAAAKEALNPKPVVVEPKAEETPAAEVTEEPVSEEAKTEAA